MAVLALNHQDNNLTLWVKGSPERIKQLCKKDTLPTNFDDVLNEATSQGERVIAFAKKERVANVSTSSFSNMSKIELETVEEDLTFIGLLFMVNKLKTRSKETIRKLNACKI